MQQPSCTVCSATPCPTNRFLYKTLPCGHVLCHLCLNNCLLGACSVNYESSAPANYPAPPPPPPGFCACPTCQAYFNVDHLTITDSNVTSNAVDFTLFNNNGNYANQQSYNTVPNVTYFNNSEELLLRPPLPNFNHSNRYNNNNCQQENTTFKLLPPPPNWYDIAGSIPTNTDMPPVRGDGMVEDYYYGSQTEGGFWNYQNNVPLFQPPSNYSGTNTIPIVQLPQQFIKVTQNMATSGNNNEEFVKVSSTSGNTEDFIKLNEGDDRSAELPSRVSGNEQYRSKKQNKFDMVTLEELLACEQVSMVKEALAESIDNIAIILESKGSNLMNELEKQRTEYCQFIENIKDHSLERIVTQCWHQILSIQTQLQFNREALQDIDDLAQKYHKTVFEFLRTGQDLVNEGNSLVTDHDIVTAGCVQLYGLSFKTWVNNYQNIIANFGKELYERKTHFAQKAYNVCLANSFFPAFESLNSSPSTMTNATSILDRIRLSTESIYQSVLKNLTNTVESAVSNKQKILEKDEEEWGTDVGNIMNLQMIYDMGEALSQKLAFKRNLEQAVASINDFRGSGAGEEGSSVDNTSTCNHNASSPSTSKSENAVPTEDDLEDICALINYSLESLTKFPELLILTRTFIQKLSKLLKDDSTFEPSDDYLETFVHQFNDRLTKIESLDRVYLRISRRSLEDLIGNHGKAAKNNITVEPKTFPSDANRQKKVKKRHNKWISSSTEKEIRPSVCKVEIDGNFDVNQLLLPKIARSDLCVRKETHSSRSSSAAVGHDSGSTNRVFFLKKPLINRSTPILHHSKYGGVGGSFSGTAASTKINKMLKNLRKWNCIGISEKSPSLKSGKKSTNRKGKKGAGKKYEDLGSELRFNKQNLAALKNVSNDRNNNNNFQPVNDVVSVKRIKISPTNDDDLPTSSSQQDEDCREQHLKKSNNKLQSCPLFKSVRDAILSNPNEGAKDNSTGECLPQPESEELILQTFENLMSLFVDQEGAAIPSTNNNNCKLINWLENAIPETHQTRSWFSTILILSAIYASCVGDTDTSTAFETQKFISYLPLIKKFGKKTDEQSFGLLKGAVLFSELMNYIPGLLGSLLRTLALHKVVDERLLKQFFRDESVLETWQRREIIHLTSILRFWTTEMLEDLRAETPWSSSNTGSESTTDESTPLETTPASTTESPSKTDQHSSSTNTRSGGLDTSSATNNDQKSNNVSGTSSPSDLVASEKDNHEVNQESKTNDEKDCGVAGGHSSNIFKELRKDYKIQINK